MHHAYITTTEYRKSNHAAELAMSILNENGHLV